MRPRTLRSSLFIALNLLANATNAATVRTPDAIYYTSGLLNGYAWMEFNEGNRTYYIIGFEEGAIRFDRQSKEFDCECSVKQISDDLTAIFRDNEIRRMPIVFAWRLVVMKANGASQQAVNAEKTRLLSKLPSVR
jgi:hypothetical protein